MDKSVKVSSIFHRCLVGLTSKRNKTLSKTRANSPSSKRMASGTPRTHHGNGSPLLDCGHAAVWERDIIM